MFVVMCTLHSYITMPSNIIITIHHCAFIDNLDILLFVSLMLKFEPSVRLPLFLQYCDQSEEGDISRRLHLTTNVFSAIRFSYVLTGS